ncbi:MAG: hypothetical protein Q9220_007506 [cf. Caloplaca sp. 1 TL-2023]
MTERLIAPINVMTTFLLRKSVERAFQLDEQPSGLFLDPSRPLLSNPPHISSAVDDTMYVVNQILDRSLTTSHRSVISSVIPSMARVLESDFIGMIQRKMRDESYPKAAVQGVPPSENIVIAFLILINDLDLASHYMKRITQSWIGGRDSTGASGQTPRMSLESLFPFEGDSVYAANALRTLHQGFESKAAELMSDGIYVVFKNVVKPRLRLLLLDAFRDMDYQLSEDEPDEVQGSIDEDDEPGHAATPAVQHQFERGWDALIRPIARVCSEGAFERLLSTLVSYLADVLEKRVWSYYDRITDLGGVRLERDIASLINVVVRGGRYGLREEFIRCTQICLVMNMEQDEWAEMQAMDQADFEAALDWRLDHDERHRARAIVQKRML